MSRVVHDAGTADARDHDAIRALERRQGRLGERLEPLMCWRRRALQPAALDGDEARAEAVDA
jgi:hypothetical protein